MRFVKICGFLYIIFGYISLVFSQVAVFDLEFRDPHLSHVGLGWPHVLSVATGHEALLRLSKSLVNQQHCNIRTPQGDTLELSNLPGNRYERWSEGCGIRIRNINKTDEGRWKLTSVRGEESLTGYSEVHVLDNKSSYDGAPITLGDGIAGAYINLTSLENYYCMVAQPFAQSTLIPGHCEITLEKSSRAIQGTWRVLLGIPGQIAELPGEKQVTVEGEHLDVGQIYDTVNNKLHLYCNIVHSEKEISFCRFQHTSSNYGYNVVDGLSNGDFSYYGSGFIYNHCGITVEHPTAQDFSSWRCSVGVTEYDRHNVLQRSAMQALISVTPQTLALSDLPDVNIRNETPSTDEKERSIFTQIGSVLNLNCQAPESLTYCWFQHPNGTQFTPGEKLDSEDEIQLFWYSGESLQMGECGISFINADESLSGKWTCHMGSTATLGVERTDSMIVHVTGPLAANQKEINATVGSNTTLHCHTSGSRTSLRYCRFVSPDFLGIHIHESVTKDKAVLGRYYFTSKMSLDYGDCSLTIDPVRYEDMGEWTCAALIVGQTLESHDTLQIYVTEPTGRFSTGSILGIVFGILGALAIGAAVIYRKKLYSRFINRNSSSPIEPIGRSSINSVSSNESLPIP